MSPVTGLARLPGRICCLFIWEISARSTGMKFKKQNQNSEAKTCIIHDCRSFVDSCNFTNKANMHTFEVEIHRLQKVCRFGRYDAKAILSKKFRPGHPGWSVHMEKISSRLPRSRSQKPRSR